MKGVKAFFLIWFLLPCIGSAQSDYKGRVLDAKTNAPIPYVNIGIVNKGIGTVSDEEGLFHLPLDTALLDTNEKIVFSSLGFKPLEIPINKIELVYNEYPVVRLEPEVVELDEVVVTNIDADFVNELVGNTNNYGTDAYGYWKDNVALGGELATRIRVKKGYRKLNSLGFEIASNKMDSILLRINIYDIAGERNISKTNLNKSGNNVLFKLRKSDTNPKIDLTPYAITVENDFVVSLELVEVYNNDAIALAIPAIHNDSGSFRRYASQDKWEKISDSGMAYYLETSVLLSKKEAEQLVKKRDKRKKRMSKVYGFVINKGRMLPKVRILNTRTKESVETDEKGKYSIYAKSSDILCFEKPNYTTRCFKVKKKTTLNVQMALDKR